MVRQRRYTIKELPPELRPRERLLAEGPEALSSAELLGLLFGIGSREKTAVELAQQVISDSGGLHGLYGVSAHELMQVNGIGEAKACIILAAVELGKRVARVRNPERPVVSSPADVDELLRGRIANADRENFIAVLLNTKNEVIGSPVISVGTVSEALVHPREVFKPAVRASAASVILAHNHPTGRVEPSRQDREVTRRLVEASGILGIDLLDHVIIGDGFFSMRENKML
ncbi:JAB domain-containing protein [Rubrobacter taiwanensis]|uniref:JAB domain-containing protein n=1 Tax=Rubrobacter taiwanensis TaxID=185139 RepID=A0A4R1BJ73_9ACTN|nr:DNA repair protein RadC [Rubrobacter taiwanensis]TCJ17334.1 JAB domain-containing protein [Rubrobacter taiwanensis]